MPPTTPQRPLSAATSLSRLLLAGALLTSLDAPRIQANLPTPLVGAWERVNIAAMLLWVAVLTVTVWRTRVARKRP